MLGMGAISNGQRHPVAMSAPSSIDAAQAALLAYAIGFERGGASRLQLCHDGHLQEPPKASRR